MPMTLVDSRHVICPQLGARSAPAPAPTKVWELGDTPCRMKARFRRNFAASQRLVHFSGGGIKVAKKRVCTMCTPWASDSVVEAPGWAGLGMFSGEWRFFKGWCPVRVPPRARAFPVQRLLGL